MSKLITGTLLGLVVLLASLLPAATSQAYVGRCGSCGTVTRVEHIDYDRDRGGQGAVAGAIIGGLLGNQVGSGDGRRAATVAGAIAGGLIGRKIDRNSDARGERGLRLEIRMDRGGYRTVEIAGAMRIYRGDRVRVRRDRVELL